jgi:LysM repeat protein
MPIQYFTMEIPFEQRIVEDMCTEDMISGSFLGLDQYHITVIPDESGEDRLLDIVADFTMEVKLYGDETIQLVQDAYSPEVDIKPQWREFNIQHLLVRNCAKAKITETVDMPKQQNVLQICNVEGSVSIDDTQRTAKGIMVEGVIGTLVTYLSKQDNGSLASTTFDIPFSHEIEVDGMQENITYSIVPFFDQIVAKQQSETQIEIRAEISLEVLAFSNETQKAILNVEVLPVDMEKKKALPGMIGYIVKPEDTLWSVAKKYYTTISRVRQINNLESDRIQAGDKLVILKE